MQIAVTTMMVIILAFSYVLDADGNASVTGYEGEATAIAVPETLNGSPVTGIADGAFYDCDSLLSVQLPRGIQTIGYGAFGECDSLLSVSLPESVQFIDEDAFDGSGRLVLTVAEGSYAHRYAVNQKLLFVFPDAAD